MWAEAGFPRVEPVNSSGQGGNDTSRVTRITAAEADPIGAELRRLYDDAATEPLPERFLDLLEQLERLEASETGE